MLCSKASRLLGAVPLATLCVALSGCGSAENRAPVSQVTGRVFLGEEPLAFGEVMFQPLQGGQPATGKITEGGSFSLSTYRLNDGAAVGRHRVRIVCYTSQDPSNQKPGPQGDSLGELLIPRRYANFSTSGIEVSVLAGGNAPFIFKLEEDPPQEVDKEDDTSDPEEESTVADEQEGVESDSATDAPTVDDATATPPDGASETL